MALTADEQKLFDFAKGALPLWVPDHDEFLYGAAKMFGSVQALISYLFGQALIGGAVGPTATTPDWLNQHAVDRGTRRQLAEDDPTLRKRLRTVSDLLTRSVILSATNAILVAGGVVAPAYLLELPRDAAHLGHYTAMAGVGGTFTQAGAVSTFTPTTLPWPAPPFRSAAVFPVLQHQLVIAGAAVPANNGTRTITGLAGNGAQSTNGFGVASVDAAVTWTVKRLDGSGNITDGFARAFLGRGYRIKDTRPLMMAVILPFTATAGLEASVREALRSKKAAGFVVRVERRLVP